MARAAETSDIPPDATRRLEDEPWVRPEAVARARAHLAQHDEPTAEQLARSMVDRLVSERVR